MPAENLDRTQSPPERVDVLADTVARTYEVNDNAAGAGIAEFIRDQLRLEALQT